MKKGAIFDMDGLLFDTERLYQEGWMAVAEQFGQTPCPEFPGAVCGTSGKGMMETIRRYYPAVDPAAYEAGCVRWVQEALERRGVPVKPGARELLEFFRSRGVKTALASGSHAGIIRNNIRRSGFEDLFDAVLSGDEAARGKPEPDVFLLAARRLGLPPGECYVFEDSVNGARAGVAAGCTTVMIPDLMPPAADLRRDCAGIYGSLLEAKKAIEAGIL